MPPCEEQTETYAQPRPKDRNIPTQHIATYVGCNMLQLGAFDHRVATCCNMLGASLTVFKLEAVTRVNMSQHITTRWPNVLCPTILRYAAMACCDRLAMAKDNSTWCSNYSMQLHVFLSVYGSICLPIRLPAYLLVCLFVCLSVRPCLSLSAFFLSVSVLACRSSVLLLVYCVLHVFRFPLVCVSIYLSPRRNCFNTLTSISIYFAVIVTSGTCN